MASRSIIEPQTFYHNGHQESRNVIHKLISINSSESVDSGSIFDQAQQWSQSSFSVQPEPIFHSNSYSQDDIFCVLSYDGTSCLIPNQQTFDAEPSSYQQPTQIDKTIDNECNDEESSQQQSSEFLWKSRKQAEGVRMEVQTDKSKKVDKQRNTFPNIAKRIAKIMFQDCRKTTQKYFKKRNISLAKFEASYKGLLESNCSGLSLSSYFSHKDQKDQQMGRWFVALFQKYLRKKYMVLAIKKGKMDQLETYISCKNRQLMYFSEYVNSQARV